MTISYVQAFPPKWILINNVGTTAGAAQLFTYDSLTRLPRATYADSAGTTPLENPIIFALNGTFGPIFWMVDDTPGASSYYIEAFDADGNKLWEQDNFPASAGGGGGGGSTFLPLFNYITNNQFINHTASISTPTNITNQLIAPSNHVGFTPSTLNPIITTVGGVVSPDIVFNKNNNSQTTDQIVFQTFALADYPLTGDVTPAEYIQYIASGSPTGETYKNFQFPITQKVKNLSNTALTFSLWAKVPSSTANIDIYFRQYFGSAPTASTEVRTLIGTCALTSSWTKFNIQFSSASVAGKSLGTPGAQTDDDASYIQIEMPLSQNSEIWFTKPCLFLGSINPLTEFVIYDQIDSINSTARTGDVRVSYQSSAPLGWLPMNDTTIGNTGSTAATKGAYLFQLYKTLWDGISNPSGNTLAPVSGGLGASAVADFLDNKNMALPLSLGRALAGTSPPGIPLGEALGSFSEDITIAANNLPPHSHVIGSYQVGGGTVLSGASSNIQFIAGSSSTGNGPGTSTPITISHTQPTSFMNVFIKI